MSGGPIKAWRDAWKPPAVSTGTAARTVHGYGGPMRAYCGRKGGVSGAFIGTWEQVTCSDCIAARRSDSESVVPGTGARPAHEHGWLPVGKQYGDMVWRCTGCPARGVSDPWEDGPAGDIRVEGTHDETTER